MSSCRGFEGTRAVQSFDPKFETRVSLLLSDHALYPAFLLDVCRFHALRARYGIQKVFDRHDADGNGTIDAQELEKVMAELGISLDTGQQAEVLRKLDKDGSGTISMEEYLQWHELYDLQSEFNEFDRDSSGSINKREVCA